MSEIKYNKLLELYGGIGLDKQHSLAEVIGDNDWSLDVEKGIISFGEELEFPMQIIGTFSYESETWLWAWDNIESNLPEQLTEQSRLLKKYGEENDIEFLTQGQLKAEGLDTHAIGMIASGMFKSSAYYCGDFGEGIIVVTLNSELIDNCEFNEQLRILSVVPSLISTFIVDHKKALYNYLDTKEYSINEDKHSITATKKGKKIHAGFDEMGRLIKLDEKI